MCTVQPFVPLTQDLLPAASLPVTSFSASHAIKLALSHPLCKTNVTAYAGQTARMHCCLARLDRELEVSE